MRRIDTWNRRLPGLSEHPGTAVVPSVFPPVLPIVAAVRAPIVTVLDDRRCPHDCGPARDRSVAKYARPANAFSAQRHVNLLP